jgi:hypothetical protein
MKKRIFTSTIAVLAIAPLASAQGSDSRPIAEIAMSTFLHSLTPNQEWGHTLSQTSLIENEFKDRASPVSRTWQFNASWASGRIMGSVTELKVGPKKPMTGTADIWIGYLDSAPALEKEMESAFKDQNRVRRALEETLITVFNRVDTLSSQFDAVVYGPSLRFEYEGTPVKGGMYVNAYRSGTTRYWDETTGGWKERNHGTNLMLSYTYPLPVTFKKNDLLTGEQIRSTVVNNLQKEGRSVINATVTSFGIGTSVGNLSSDTPEYKLFQNAEAIPWYAVVVEERIEGRLTRTRLQVGAISGAEVLPRVDVTFPFSISTDPRPSLLPGIYTLPNGWKATLSPAQPPQSTTWQPTTLKYPNGDTLKAEADPNLRFYKINGTTYLRSRIPG